MEEQSIQVLLLRIKELEEQLEESVQLIEAIKTGEVDAFAINNENEPEIYTLQSGDYAYRVLIEEFGEGAINVTEEGLIVYTNRYFFELLKLSYEEVIGASIFDFIHPASLKTFKQLFKESLAGKSKGEINLIIGENILPVYVSLTSLQPKLASIGIVISDLSEKRNRENVILEYQKSLERKNIELIQSNAELASFAYIASHDLQEPLRKIQTFSSLILEKELSNLSETGKDHFKRMQNSAGRMQTLIKDLLAYSRTNTAGRKFENINLAELAREVKADLKEELLQKQATIEVTGTGNANVIPFQFRQLLHNLISNSLKFSANGKAPCIRIRNSIAKAVDLGETRLDQDKHYFHIHYSDNGIGFEQEYNEKIFELFQRLHGKTEYQGTGIGLAIVKKIVENHKGVIIAKGEINKGATFNIYVPISDRKSNSPVL